METIVGRRGRRSRIAVFAFAACLGAAGCSQSLDDYLNETSGSTGDETITTGGEEPVETTTTMPVPVEFIAFGDAADCRGRDAEVAALVDESEADILFVGDAAYPDGSAEDFANCFLPLYGDDLARFHAVPGDNDYKTPGASEFFSVFGTSAGAPGTGWFVFETNGWQIIGMNSECDEVGGCDEGSPQYQWLQATLAAAPDACRLAFWQLPRFTSSANYQEINRLGPLYDLLYDARTDLLLVGNSHHYERFDRLGKDGSTDDRGIRNITVGTGGAPLTEFAPEPRAGSAVRNNKSHGFLRLSLLPNEYSWTFVGATEQSDLVDSGASSCVKSES